jgi:hypothetical protein
MATDEEKTKAMRLARAIASDISVYNDAKIAQAIEADTFFDALSDEIQEGRDLYKSRVSGALYVSSNYYERAIVDIVLRSRGHIRSPLWL